MPTSRKRYSAVHVLGFVVAALIFLLFLIRDDGPFPIFALPSRSSPAPQVAVAQQPSPAESSTSNERDDLMMLGATIQQLASIENDYSASEVKFRELMTYGVTHAGSLPKDEVEQFNAEFRQVMASMVTTLGRSKRVMPVPLHNREANRHLDHAVSAHQRWSATQSAKLSALLSGELETAMKLAKDDTAVKAEAESIVMAYKALGMQAGQ